MPTPGLYFAIYYEVPDRAFYRAAWTWAMETLGGTTTPDTYLVLEPVATEADFRRAWETVDNESKRVEMPIAEGQIFSHASKGSNVDGLEFRPGSDGDGTLSQSDVLGLPRLNWASDAQLVLTGCNTGLAGTRGWAPAGVFARRQGVTTIGQAGYGYFSTNRSAYSEINANSQTVYLWAYKRGRNGMLGGGGRMPGVVFAP
jgi:hypothetical protein